MNVEADRRWLAEWVKRRKSPLDKFLEDQALQVSGRFKLIWWAYFVPSKLHRFRECIEEGRTIQAAFLVASRE